jgi:hypothetical protein
MSNIEDDTHIPSGQRDGSDTTMSSRHGDQQGGNPSALGPGPAQFTGNDMSGVISAGDSGPDSIPGVVANPDENTSGIEGENIAPGNGGPTTTNMPRQGGTTFGPGTTGFGSGSGGAGGPTITGGNTGT